MSNAKKVAVIIAGIFVALLVISFVVGSMINIFIPPSEALFGDKLIEDIGGDNALVATLDGCLKVSEESIPDGNFITQSGQSLSWFDAKNITFVDVYGYKGNMIVWKAPIEKYSVLRDVDGGGYISDYINSSDKNCFLVHFSGSDAVYGIILDNENIYVFIENHTSEKQKLTTHKLWQLCETKEEITGDFTVEEYQVLVLKCKNSIKQ